MRESFLKCFVASGMFSDELAVKYPARSIETTRVNSFFVPKDQVVDVVNQLGKVRVRVYQEGQNVWAILPTENEAAILVEDDDLVKASSSLTPASMTLWIDVN